MTSAETLTEISRDGAETRRRAWITVACITFYVAMAVALFWPVAPWDSSHIIDGPFGQGYGDPTQTLWFLEWVPFALRHGLNLFNTNYFNYPIGVDLADNPMSSLLGLLASPVTLTLGPVVAFNLLLRLAFASSAASMFLLLRTWCRWPAAFVGGIFYGFGPYMISQGHTHLDLVFMPIPPLIVWCVYELLVTRHHHPVIMGAVLGALAGAQALIDPEMLALLAVVGGIALIVVGASNYHALRTRLDLVWASASAIVVFGVIAGYLLWSMLFAPGHLVAPPQPLVDLQLYRSDLLGPLVPTSSQLLAPAALAHVSATYVDSNVSENATYLGLPLVLFVGFVAVRWRRDRVVLLAAILALVAFIFSLGPSLVINSHNTGIWLPEGLLTHLPLVDGVVPARFALVVSLFVAIVIGIGLDLLMDAITTRTSVKRGVAIGAVAVLVVSFAFILPRAPLASQTLPGADSIASLDAIPSGSVVLTYPFTVYPWTEGMYWQAADGMRFRIVGGYGDFHGPQNTGTGVPPLLVPAFLQEYFVAAQNGVSSQYPAPNTDVNAGKALCQFVARYDVGAVVFWDVGADPTKIKNLLVNTLGPPTQTSSDQQLNVWLTGSGSGTGTCS